MPHKYLLKEFEDFARSAVKTDSVMAFVSQRAHAHIPRYNWVGFYLVDRKDTSLQLGPHTGSFHPNPKISLDQGLVGLCASTCRVIVADNVALEPHYLQASDLVKSQISVPVVSREKLAGVFNVESYFLSAFKRAEDREFVERCAQIVGRCFSSALTGDFVNA
jgi:GAF domain-containing protein